MPCPLLQKATKAAGQGDYALCRAKDGLTSSLAFTRALFRPTPAGKAPVGNPASEKKSGQPGQGNIGGPARTIETRSRFVVLVQQVICSEFQS